MIRNLTLANLLEERSKPHPPLQVIAPDTCVTTLLGCLKAKAGSIPMETVHIGKRFVKKLENEPPTEFKTVAARTMESYAQTLKKQYQDLLDLIKLGETLQKEHDVGADAQRHHKIWCFLARTMPAQEGQDL